MGVFEGEEFIFDKKKGRALIGKSLKNYQSRPKMMILGVCGHFLSDFDALYGKMGVFRVKEFIFSKKMVCSHW